MVIKEFKIDLSDIKENFPNLQISAIELAGPFDTAPDDFQIKLKVDVKSKKYNAESNYHFWGVDQAAPYRGTHHNTKTPTKAIRDVYIELTMFKNQAFSKEQYCWAKVESGKEILIDGTGKRITHEEFLKRQQEHRKPK